jgi:galactokinase|tara:strand:+ start:370 stop:594 length:225 start_codon:yes stop_codon:yes gene_type:complete
LAPGPPRDDSTIEVIALDYNIERSCFSLDKIEHASPATWSNYEHAICKVLLERFSDFQGANIAVTGNGQATLQR